MVVKKPLKLLLRCHSDPAHRDTSEPDRDFRNHLDLGMITIVFMNPKHITGTPDDMPPITQFIGTSGTSPYPVQVCVQCGLRSGIWKTKHCAGQTCCFENEPPEVILGRFLAGTLPLFVYLKADQTYVVPFLLDLIIHDITNWELPQQMALSRVTYEYLKHIAGHTRAQSAWATFCFEHKMLPVKNYAMLFINGLRSSDIFIDIWLRLLNLGWGENEIYSSIRSTLEQTIEILKTDSVAARQFRSVGGVTYGDRADAAAEKFLKGRTLGGDLLVTTEGVDVKTVQRVLCYGITRSQYSIVNQFKKTFEKYVKVYRNQTLRNAMMHTDFERFYDGDDYDAAVKKHCPAGQKDFKMTDFWRTEVDKFIFHMLSGAFGTDTSAHFHSVGVGEEEPYGFTAYLGPDHLHDENVP